MINFKQWHEDAFFYREIKLYFSRCDKEDRFSLSELLSETSDTAVEDYQQRGMSHIFLRERGFAILVSRISFKIIKPPVSEEIIAIKTWEEAPTGLQLTRRYEITGEDGSARISGLSTWIIVDPEKRRIIKPSQFTLRPEPTMRLPFDGMPCGKINAADGLEFLGERVVRYSDIDANGHMNNSRYGAYIADCLPPAYRNKQMTDFRINYAREAVEGDALRLFGDFSDERKAVIAGRTDAGVCFESEIYY